MSESLIFPLCERESVASAFYERTTHLCKQGVVGSSPIVSTALIRTFIIGRGRRNLWVPTIPSTPAELDFSGNLEVHTHSSGRLLP